MNYIAVVSPDKQISKLTDTFNKVSTENTILDYFDSVPTMYNSAQTRGIPYSRILCLPLHSGVIDLSTLVQVWDSSGSQEIVYVTSDKKDSEKACMMLTSALHLVIHVNGISPSTFTAFATSSLDTLKNLYKISDTAPLPIQKTEKAKNLFGTFTNFLHKKPAISDSNTSPQENVPDESECTPKAVDVPEQVSAVEEPDKVSLAEDVDKASLADDTVTEEPDQTSLAEDTVTEELDQTSLADDTVTEEPDQTSLADDTTTEDADKASLAEDTVTEDASNDTVQPSLSSNVAPVFDTVPKLNTVSSDGIALGADAFVTPNMTSAPEIPSENIPALDTVKQVSADTLLIGGEDAKYREKIEAPKVVEKVTEKIVEKVVVQQVDSKGKKGKTINFPELDAVVHGEERVVLTVTGDRRTGVTNYALSLAKYFVAKKLNVLLVDLDITLHGLLSYIDYDDFSDYGEEQKQGLRLCHSKEAFERALIRYKDGYDLITTDYGVKIDPPDSLAQFVSVILDSTDAYDVVIFDVPYAQLCYCEDLVASSQTEFLCDGSWEGVMNCYQLLDGLALPLRVKRLLRQYARLVHTCGADADKHFSDAHNQLSFNDIDWTQVRHAELPTGALTDAYVNALLC